jgi:glycosyltransferase 2 family protein
MRQILSFALRTIVSGILLYFAFAQVNFNFIGQRLDRIDYRWLAAAVFIFIAQTMVGALRWHKIVGRCEGPEKSPFTVPNAIRYNFIAAFFNQTLPSTIGGDAVRIWLLGRDQGGWRPAAYSVLIDRFIGVLVLALLVILCMPWSFALIGDIAGRIALLIVGFGSVAACLAFIALGFIRWPWLERWRLTRELVAAASTARAVFSSQSSGPIIAYSLLNHFMSVTAAWCLAKSLAAPLEWSQALLLILPVLLIATIPLSIAGWGTRETAMVLAFGYAGLPEGDGLVVSILMGIAMFAVGLAGGALWILDRGTRRLHPPP